MHYESLVDTRAYQVIAIEAGFVSNAISSVINFFPSVFKNAKKGIARLFTVDKYDSTAERHKNVEFTKMEKTVLARIAEADMINLNPLKVIVPEGFKGNYVDYGRALIETFSYNKDVLLPAVEEYYVLIADVITNRNAKLSNKDITRTFKGLEKSRDTLNDQLASFFAKGGVHPEKAIKDVFRNRSEFETLFKTRLEIGSRLESTNIDSLMEKSKQLVDAMDTLLKLAEEGKIEELSAVQMQNLASGGYEIAKQIEFFSVNYYRCMTYYHSVEHVLTKLNTAL